MYISVLTAKSTVIYQRKSLELITKKYSQIGNLFLRALLALLKKLKILHIKSIRYLCIHLRQYLQNPGNRLWQVKFNGRRQKNDDNV